MSPEERAALLELVRWFERRYPTPLERLAYVRQGLRAMAAHDGFTATLDRSVNVHG